MPRPRWIGAGHAEAGACTQCAVSKGWACHAAPSGLRREGAGTARAGAGERAAGRRGRGAVPGGRSRRAGTGAEPHAIAG
jgi:hypothetical protein